MFKPVKTLVAMAVAVIGLSAQIANAEDIKLRIASGHATANTYVALMQSFFAPEVTKRVAARTTLVFINWHRNHLKVSELNIYENRSF